jgi:hypothetical protein
MGGLIILGLWRAARGRARSGKNAGGQSPSRAHGRWWVFGGGWVALLALGGGAAFYFSQQPRSIGGMVWADSPDGRYSAGAGTKHAMRLFGSDRTFFRFSVQGPDFFEHWETRIPYDRLATNYADRYVDAYAFRGQNGTARGQIVWSDDSQRVSFLMRGIEVSAYNVVDRSHSSQPGYQPQREVELAGNNDLRDCFLDLDTGRVLSAPADMVETLRARNQLAQSERVREWMRANGVDLWKEGSGRGLDQLDGVQMLMAEKTGRRADLRAFDTLTTNQVAEAVGAVDEVLKNWESHSGGNPRRFTLTADHVHAVKTREGGVALVEILEEDPRSGRTRLRYKLVQSRPVIERVIHEPEKHDGVGG